PRAAWRGVRRSPCRRRPAWSSRRACGPSTRRTRPPAAHSETAAVEATRRARASTQSRHTPTHGATAAARAAAGPHQIAAGILTGTYQITRRLLVRLPDPNRNDLTQPKQPRQPLSLPPDGLTTIR